MSKDEDNAAGSSHSLRSLEDEPSVRELEALEQKDRKATEDLLSGFDRPARTPRTPHVRDFVDYYSNPGKRPPAPAPSPNARLEERSPHEKPTVIIPRKSRLSPTTVWVLAVAGVMLFGAIIAVLVTPAASTPRASPSTPVVMPTMAPTSATTITSANPIPVDTTSENDSTTTTDTVIVAPAPPPKKTTPSTTITSGATSAPTIQTAPRDDFIRDM